MDRLQVQKMIRQLAESNQEKRRLISTVVEILGVRFISENIGIGEFLLMFTDYVDGSTIRRSRQRLRLLLNTLNLHDVSEQKNETIPYPKRGLVSHVNFFIYPSLHELYKTKSSVMKIPISRLYRKSLEDFAKKNF
jgi:hypothetical protein